MNASAEALYEHFADSKLHIDISYALEDLEDDLMAADYFGAPHWSNIFNTYSNACAILHENPDTELIDKPVALPENTPWLGQQLIRLLNGSVARDSTASYQIADQDPVTEEGEDTYVKACELAEERFVACGGWPGAPDLTRPQDIFVDDANRPVLFAKGYGNESALSLSEISINGVAHTAGTIFYFRRNDSIPYLYADPALEEKEPYQSSDIRVSHLESLASLRPLRLSLFPVPSAQRVETITPEKSYKMEIAEWSPRLAETISLGEMIQAPILSPNRPALSSPTTSVMAEV